MTTALNQTSPFKTVRQVLPYEFRMCMDGRLAIYKTDGKAPLKVTRGQVEHILEREDLDAHRRKMYEAALEYFKKAVQ